MKWLGVLIAAIVLVYGITLSGNPGAFINIPSLIFVLGLGTALICASHGLRWFGVFVSHLRGQRNEEFKRIAETGRISFIASGWIGAVVGAIQSLSQLEDPNSLGVSVAMCLLTLLYGYVIATFFWLPLERETLSLGTN